MRTGAVIGVICVLSALGCAKHATPEAPAAGSGEASGGGGGMQAPSNGGAPSEQPPDEGQDAQAPDAIDEPMSSDAGVLVPREDAAVDAPELGPLATQLVGHWLDDGHVGNCFAFETWYSFEADGSVVNRLLDDNACSGLRLVDEVAGAYTLEGNTLSLTLEGMGSDRPFEMSSTDATIGRRLERFTIAIAERPAHAEHWPGRVYLDGEAFTSSDGARYESERYVRVDDAAGAVLFEQRARVTLALDPPLPLVDGATTRVQVHFELSRLDTALAADPVVDTFDIAFDATASTDELGWRQIIADELLAVPLEERWAAWDALLVAQALDAHGETFAWTFRQHVFPQLGFDAADPNTLSVGLPGSGRWYKSDEPPRDAERLP